MYTCTQSYTLDCGKAYIPVITLWIASQQPTPLSVAAYQKHCALFDESIKFGTHVDYHHQINIFGYGSAHKCTQGDHND